MTTIWARFKRYKGILDIFSPQDLNGQVGHKTKNFSYLWFQQIHNALWAKTELYFLATLQNTTTENSLNNSVTVHLYKSFCSYATNFDTNMYYVPLASHTVFFCCSQLSSKSHNGLSSLAIVPDSIVSISLWISFSLFDVHSSFWLLILVSNFFKASFDWGRRVFASSWSIKNIYC